MFFFRRGAAERQRSHPAPLKSERARCRGGEDTSSIYTCTHSCRRPPWRSPLFARRSRLRGASSAHHARRAEARVHASSTRAATQRCAERAHRRRAPPTTQAAVYSAPCACPLLLFTTSELFMTPARRWICCCAARDGGTCVLCRQINQTASLISVCVLLACGRGFNVYDGVLVYGYIANLSPRAPRAFSNEPRKVKHRSCLGR